MLSLASWCTHSDIERRPSAGASILLLDFLVFRIVEQATFYFYKIPSICYSAKAVESRLRQPTLQPLSQRPCLSGNSSTSFMLSVIIVFVKISMVSPYSCLWPHCSYLQLFRYSAIVFLKSCDHFIYTRSWRVGTRAELTSLFLTLWMVTYTSRHWTNVC